MSSRARIVAGIAAAAVASSLTLAACGSTTAPSPSPSASASTSPAYAEPLEQTLSGLMEANAVPGAVVLIRSRDQGNWTKSFGTAVFGADVPMPADPFLRIGSNTKTMTSTVILQLVQEGKLALADPVAKFRPEVPNGQNITIEQLSTMRSGLYNYSDDAGFNAALDNDPTRVWSPDQLTAISFAHPPNFAPGAKYEYSNTNIILLGQILEQITGKTASQAFQERIFAPLDLTQTSLPPDTDTDLPDPHPRGYQFGTNVQDLTSYALPPGQVAAALNGSLAPIDYTAANSSWAWTAGGAISTPEELADYVTALVAGGLLDPAMQKQRLDSVRPIADTPTPAYGLGIVEFSPNLFGHDGQIPGFSTFMGHDAVSGTTIVVGANLSASPVTGENTAVLLAKPIIAELYGAQAVSGGDPAAASSGSASATTSGPAQ